MRGKSVKSFPVVNGTRLLAALLAVMLTGCAVGPDFKTPEAPQVNAYTPGPLSPTAAAPGVAAGEAQNFVPGADIAADWWSLFHAPALSDLIALSLKNNYDLKAAEATLRQAHENTLAQHGAFLPSVTAGFAASHQQEPATLAPVPSNNAIQYNLFTPQLSVSYVPDVFGLTRRTVESYEAQADAARYQMYATYITLVNNVVVAAVQEASTQAQVDATRRLVAAETKSVEILRYQKEKGYASGADLAAQNSQLAQAQTTLPPLLKQLAQYHDQLAALTGRYPSQTPPETLKLSDLTLPQALPLTLPSELVARRPDVLQAQANLHAASAQIGIAVANRLPNIQLTAQAGSTALAFNQLLLPGTQFWNIGAALTAPIFDGGTLRHQEHAARAAFDASADQYRSTVLTSFQNVADTLTALSQDAQALKAAAAADTAAKTSLDIVQWQLKDGYTNYLGLLVAQQAYQQAEIALVQAQAARFADTAALFQALGGGWWHRTDLHEAQDDQ